MSTVAELDQQIEALSARRQELWDSRDPSPDEVSRIGEKLSHLYEERRRVKAQAMNGTRKEIFHRARIEYEIEKLMGRSPDEND